MQTKKNLKGMTLIEIVISIAIYGMIALLITEAMCLINATIRSTQQLNTRLSYEAKYADNLLTSADGVAFASLEEEVTLTYNDGTPPNTVNAPAVHVSIVYDLDSEHSATGKVLNRNQYADYKEDGGTPLLRAAEYETNYNGTVVGTNYHPNTNYKFMTFNKVSAAAAQKPSGDFLVHLTLADADADKITRIRIEAAPGVLTGAGVSVGTAVHAPGALDDEPDVAVQFVELLRAAQDGGKFATDQVLDIPIFNNAPASGDFGTTFQNLRFIVYKDVTAATSGNTLNDMYTSNANLTVYTAVQVSSYENYYEQCDISYAGATWSFPQSS